MHPFQLIPGKNYKNIDKWYVTSLKGRYKSAMLKPGTVFQVEKTQESNELGTASFGVFNIIVGDQHYQTSGLLPNDISFVDEEQSEIEQTTLSFNKKLSLEDIFKSLESL